MKRLGIRHVSGPLAGRQIDFGADRLRIVVGTAESCQVRFPAGAADVSAEHCELVRDAGRYELRVNSADPVFIGVRRAEDGEELADGATLHLGSPQGPALEIEYLADEGKSQRPSTGAAAILRRSMRRHPRVVRALVAVTCLLAAGAFLWSRKVAEDRRLERLLSRQETETQIARAIAAAEEKLRTFSWATVLDRVRPSVYLVLQKTPGVGEEAMGTAWVVAPGRLATNAHVAEAIAEMRRKFPRRQFVARSSVEPHVDVAVTDVVSHPAFWPFMETWVKYAPLQLDAGGQKHNRRLVPGYDVAILSVDTRQALEPPLPRASMDTLRAARPGDPVAFVGFPSEALVEVDLTRPNPRTQIGAIVSVASFTLTKAPPGQGQLVEHSIPSTGGASGSPIVNTAGQVVGLLSAGNTVPLGNTGRTPSAAQVNYAQRVDLTDALLGERPTVDLDALRRSWLQDLQRYDNLDKAIDRDIARFRQGWADKHAAAGTPQEVRHETLSGPWTRFIGNPSFSTTWDLEAGTYLILARGHSRRDVNASAFYRTGDLFGMQQLAKDEADDCWPTLTFVLTEKRQVVLMVGDATKPRPDGTPDEGPQPVEVWVLKIAARTGT